jgi:hypothetical protein
LLQSHSWLEYCLTILNKGELMDLDEMTLNWVNSFPMRIEWSTFLANSIFFAQKHHAFELLAIIAPQS